MNAKITQGIMAIFLIFLCLSMAQGAEKKGGKTMQQDNAQNTAGAPTSARVINVEFKFAPFVGDPAKAKTVETVPGKARLFLNNVLVGEEDVRKEMVLVMFKEREIMAVWVPIASLGTLVHKGKNILRVEFEPADPKATYQAQLSWTQVMDQSAEKSEPGRYQATNQSGEGKEIKKGKGKIILEKEFTADFAADLP